MREETKKYQKTMDGYVTEEDEELVCDGLAGCLTLRDGECFVENRCAEDDVETVFIDDCLNALLSAGPTRELLTCKRDVVAVLETVPSLRLLRRRYFSDYEVHIQHYVDGSDVVMCGIWMRRVAANGRFMAPTSPVPFSL